MILIKKKDVSILDYVFSKYKNGYGTEENFNRLKVVYSIIRDVDFPNEAFNSANFSAEGLGGVNIRDDDIQVIYSYFVFDDIYITADDVVDWYRERYMLLNNNQTKDLFDFFFKIKVMLSNSDISFFNFDSIEHFDKYALLKEILLHPDTYNNDCVFARSDTQFLVGAKGNYRIRVKNDCSGTILGVQIFIILISLTL